MSTSSDASVLLTIYNREYEVILSTLRSLARSLTENDEVVIVDDGSTFDYTGPASYAVSRLPCKVRWIVAGEYEAYNIDGFNNPARAFNLALEAAIKPNLYIMSSDVMVTPLAVARARKFDLSEMAFVPLVIDIESGAQYCGPSRLFPAPWFLGVSRKHAIDCGGWDENYLQGMCYEDNDFMGRVMLHTGRFLGDWSVAVYHQSHDQPAYEVADPEIAAANKRNREYTLAKWKGIPFAGGQDSCFDVTRKPYLTGDVIHECRYYEDKLQKVIAATKSPFVEVPA